MLWGAQPLLALRSPSQCYVRDRHLRRRQAAEAGPVGQRAGRRKCCSRRSSLGLVRRWANLPTPRHRQTQNTLVEQVSAVNSVETGTARRSGRRTAEVCGADRMPMWLRTRARACEVGKRVCANRCPNALKSPNLNSGGRGRGPSEGPPLRSSVKRQCAANAACSRPGAGRHSFKWVVIVCAGQYHCNG